MITMTIQIQDTKVPFGSPVPGNINEFGAGVLVKTEGAQLKTATDSEGATWAGLCTAINEYMRSRGARDFDCLRQMTRN